MTQLLVASNNPKKLSELRSLLASTGISVVGPADMGLRLIPDETGDTFAANARLKAEAFSATSGLPALADDSGIVVDALGGAPGIYSARFAGEDATDADRNARLLDQLVDVPWWERTARFVCAIAIAAQGEETVVFEDTAEGVIALEPRGSGGFGYDPIFFYPPLQCTFGELSQEGKAEVSHRGKALRRAEQYLTTGGGAGILEGWRRKGSNETSR
jgi:XTP/dITP diphosphohydrolase